MNLHSRLNIRTETIDATLLDIKVDRHAGRVKKNTGLKKYNQRMLREIGNVKI